MLILMLFASKETDKKAPLIIKGAFLFQVERNGYNAVLYAELAHLLV